LDREEREGPEGQEEREGGGEERGGERRRRERRAQRGMGRAEMERGGTGGRGRRDSGQGRGEGRREREEGRGGGVQEEREGEKRAEREGRKLSALGCDVSLCKLSMEINFKNFKFHSHVTSKHDELEFLNSLGMPPPLSACHLLPSLVPLFPSVPDSSLIQFIGLPHSFLIPR
jgi:hypothetical protein